MRNIQLRRLLMNVYVFFFVEIQSHTAMIRVYISRIKSLSNGQKLKHSKIRKK